MKHAWISGALACGMLLIAVAAYTLSHWGGVLTGRKIIHQEESKYQNLYITRKGSVITLRAGSLLVKSSAMDLSSPNRLVIEYTRMMMLGTGYVDTPRSMLVLGLGGGTMTKYLRSYFPKARIVSIEFDEAVVSLAREHFGFEPDENMELAVMDGRRYLSKTDQTYDIVFLDAFHGDYIPFHLMTREFLSLVRSRLAPGGVVVSNTWQGQKLSQRETATYQAVFGNFDNYLGVRSSNRVIIAGREGRTLDRRELLARMSESQQRLGYREIDLVQLFNTHYQGSPAPSLAEALTDDFAPVNLLVDRRSVSEEEE